VVWLGISKRVTEGGTDRLLAGSAFGGLEGLAVSEIAG